MGQVGEGGRGIIKSIGGIVTRGVARNLIWVGINGSRRQNNHIKMVD